MNEDFLHFVWKFKLDDHTLYSTDGQTLEIISPGNRNHDAGPDFVGAQVKIGDTRWAGNVEIHVRASDWARHKHQSDDAYDNVILHVVHDDDFKVRRKSGEFIPTLALKEILHPELFETYNFFLHNHLWIPCAFSLHEVRDIVVQDWMEALAVIRLERKSAELENLLQFCESDWNQAFYEALASTLGFRINKQPFELMARQTPVRFLEKHKDELFQVEAMLFGQSGLLERKYREAYPKNLVKEYRHLKNKFSLEPISGHLWKFMRLRPNNFPTIRLAQLAMMIHDRSHFFSSIIDHPEYDYLADFFTVGVSSYWEEHFYFDRPSRKMSKTISGSTIDLILINNVVPFLFLYGKMKNQLPFQEKALGMLNSISPESNSIIRRFAEFGLVPSNASQSQALLELKTNFCENKRCLECRIGLDLIR